MRTFLRTSGVALGVDLATIAALIYCLAVMVLAVRSQHWLSAAIDLALAALVASWLPRRWRTFRSADHQLRAELIRAARPVRKGQVWVNRDEHVIFAGRHALGTSLRRWDEDDFRNADSDGRGQAISVTYIAGVIEWGILRVVDGQHLEAGPDGLLHVRKDTRSQYAKWRDAAKLARWSGTAVMHADAAEVRSVLAELASAELVDA